ncbi:MAG: TIGR00300 family protein [Thaumarchaeota archaeon]|nr:TIGR00300 family protein [Nitrososphaerota archaeon]MCL5316871.1 TIGR00300 family protein [Nitrososphaerota archaeon]
MPSKTGRKPGSQEPKRFTRQIEVKGHLIDSMILTRIFDRIMDLKGEFEVEEFRIGRRKKDYSYARLLVKGESQAHLERMLEEIYRDGAIPVELETVDYEPSPKDKVLPDNFYSTTNHQTFVYLNSGWVEVENQMMDKAIVLNLKENRAACRLIRDIKKGDLVVVGEAGIRVVPPERPREGVGVFQFMSSQSSIEKPTQTITRRIAEDIFRTKNEGGKVAIVAGPAVVHTGAATSLAKMIRDGYVDALLAGNALAVHDVEYSIFKTSLGMYLDEGTAAFHGHRHHMAAINEVFKAGSLEEAVKKGVLKSGIIYECVKKGVPFVLAGSIRDDGPLPDVVTDSVEAQRRYREVLKDVNVVLMISTVLHSIAVGNMLPSSVKVVAVDINPSSVTKLLDRGSGQAVGLVSDIGTFLPVLVRYLEELKNS